MRQDIGNNKPTRKEGDIVEMAGANISFSWKGLQKMATFLAKDIGNLADRDYRDGMKAHAIGNTASPITIGDPIKAVTNEPDWEEPSSQPELLHVIVLVTGNDDAQIKQKRPGVGFDAVLGQLSKSEQVDITGLFPQYATRAVKLNAVSPFVVPRGGEYFCAPSMSALSGILSIVKDGKSEL